MAAAAAAVWSSYPSHRLSTPAKKKLSNSPKSIFPSSFCPSKPTLSLSPPPIHASNSPVEDETSSSDGIIPQEDLKYLWKLGAGSVAASALIKYGSVLFPQITTPNLFAALVVVSTPVIVAVFILVKKSRSL